MTIDLHSMPVSELVELKSLIETEIKSREGKQREEALATIMATAKNAGISVRELIGMLSAPAKQKNPVAVRYQDKLDPNKTWTGRGRQPGWVKDWLASGKSLSDIAV